MLSGAISFVRESVTPCMCSHRNNSFFSCILLFYGVFDVSSTVIILNVVV